VSLTATLVEDRAQPQQLFAAVRLHVRNQRRHEREPAVAGARHRPQLGLQVVEPAQEELLLVGEVGLEG